MRAPRATALVAITLLGLVVPRVGSAWCRTTTPLTPPGRCEAGTPVSWPITCVGIFINTRELSVPPARGQDLAAILRRAVTASVEAWSEAPCASTGPSLRLVVPAELDLPLDVPRDGRNVISVNRRWTPDALHRPGTIAFTLVSTDVLTGTLLEADVELNALSMENPLGREFGEASPIWGVADAPTVILHELGHVAGLGHSLEIGAVMESSMDVERQRRTLTDDDRRGICAMYPSSAARGRPPAGCRAEQPEIPPGWPMARGGCSAARGLAPRWDVVLFIVGVGLAFRRGKTAATVDEREKKT